jgi:hypothetical protein
MRRATTRVQLRPSFNSETVVLGAPYYLQVAHWEQPAARVPKTINREQSHSVDLYEDEQRHHDRSQFSHDRCGLPEVANVSLIGQSRYVPAVIFRQ